VSERRPRLEELDWRQTPMGAISLRRRREPTLDVDVYEVKLDDDFLMSSLFTVAEVELARLALAEVDGDGLDVVVGGLGLAYTARTVLDDARVSKLIVVEALPQVVGWHQQGLIPSGRSMVADPRCRLVTDDFFALTASAAGYDPESPGARFDAVIVDIDHSPAHLLRPGHANLYTPAGLEALRTQLRPGGVFALWSNDPPDKAFEAVLAEVFDIVRSDVVDFRNPIQGGRSANTVYLAR
jgi:spermidine synthase